MHNKTATAKTKKTKQVFITNYIQSGQSSRGGVAGLIVIAGLISVSRRALFVFRVNGASDQPGKGLSEPGCSCEVVIGPDEQEALTIDIGAIGHVGQTVYGEPHDGVAHLLDQNELHRDILAIRETLHTCKGSMVSD